jgi:hypothetical protein
MENPRQPHPDLPKALNSPRAAGYEDRRVSWSLGAPLQWLHCIDRSVIAAPHPFAAPKVSTTNAFQAFTDVLEKAGATLPKRDAVDERIVKNVRTGTGSIIQSPKEIPSCCQPDY